VFAALDNSLVPAAAAESFGLQSCAVAGASGWNSDPA